MQFLDIDTAIELHKLLVDQFGGMHGIRDKNLLESALSYPQMLHTLTLEQNGYVLAAAYFYHIIQNHPFIDGNKRIGALAMMTFLKMNGYPILIPHAKLYELAISIASSKLHEKEIAYELEKYASTHN
ncbi:MAG: type II toxin-antitoxin system death-on-curing family toxin [Epsilonproteobacteria bacterium]|nr:type II toxin-antitoxin system death-on-curing family toxin [Campylobacterota bacterium]